jgi:poly(A) polymerase
MTSNDGAAAHPPSLAGAPWLTRAETRAVLDALTRGGHEARIVGGAVRNALLGAPVKDIDVATTAVPEDVVRLAEAAGLRAVATGITHGTVTVIAGRQPIEVTTLRRDIQTDGRHAKVAFTTDWAEDAGRRDFTINALYCDASGTVFDPLGGYGDLAARRVRFIGSAEDRIREDYLRILRFFRFTAAYAAGTPDGDGLAACVALAAGLAKLSPERVRAEFLRLLGARHAIATLEVMAQSHLLAPEIGTSGDVALAGRVAAIEATIPRDADPLMRLAALISPITPSGLALLDAQLRLSNAESERLARLTLPEPSFRPESPESSARAFLYRFGGEAFRDGVLLAWARSGDAPTDARWRTRFTLPDRWDAPSLPVRGADLLAAGLAEGPAIGRVVRAFEDWWIAEDFPDDPMMLARKLSDLVKANRD